jgi:hypothetical protein
MSTQQHHRRKDNKKYLFLPWPFHKGGVENLLPSVQALQVRPIRQGLGDLLPVALSIENYGSGKNFVL